MDNPIDFKFSLENITKPYLDQLYDKMVEAKIVSVPTTKPNIRTGDSDEENWPPARKIITQLQDLRTVMQVVYPGLSGNDHLKTFLAYLKFFNDTNIIDIPLSDQRLQSLFENINNLDEENFSEEWMRALSENKVDLTALCLVILESFSKKVITDIGKKYDFIFDPQLKEYQNKKVTLSVKEDHSKVVLLDIKYRYRSSVTDLKNIFHRGIDKLTKYKLQYKYASKYLLMVLYTDRQEHELGKLISQFNKFLLDAEQSLLRKVFFVPITLHKINDAEVKIEECYRKINGQQITFNYTGPLFSNGWHPVGIHVRNITSLATQVKAKNYGLVLRANLPSHENVAMIHAVPELEAWNPSSAAFTIKPIEGFRLLVHFVMQGNDQVYTIKVVAGERESKVTGRYELIKYVPLDTSEDWQLVRVDVLDAIEKDFKMDKRKFQKIKAVSIGGMATVARIQFE